MSVINTEQAIAITIIHVIPDIRVTRPSLSVFETSFQTIQKPFTWIIFFSVSYFFSFVYFFKNVKLILKNTSRIQ